MLAPQSTPDPLPLWNAYHELRAAMVESQIVARGIDDLRVLSAIRDVPRHVFFTGTPEDAYADRAQPIDCHQTISQPYIVALMTEALALNGEEHVLEIGSGSGYQSAILALLARRVIAMERHSALAESSRTALHSLGLSKVTVLEADGSRGWQHDAPYDAILVAAAAPQIPVELTQQLAPGGRLILPVGPENALQKLMLVTRDRSTNRLFEREIADVRFVPLVGSAGYGLPDDLGFVDI